MTIARTACAAAIIGLLGVSTAQGFDQSAQKSGQTVGQNPKQPTAGVSAAVTGLRGEWHLAGSTFVCQVAAPRQLPPAAVNPDILGKACLHMGPFGIGNDAKTITSALGPPHRSLPQPGDTTALVYFLEEANKLPYLVATVHEDQIVALQVSGVATSKDYTFNHIKLGDDTATLVRYFGKAHKVGPSGEKDTDLWAYSSWPFSFEVKSGRVTSVRIVDPAFEQQQK